MGPFGYNPGNFSLNGFRSRYAARGSWGVGPFRTVASGGLAMSNQYDEPTGRDHESWGQGGWPPSSSQPSSQSQSQSQSQSPESGPPQGTYGQSSQPHQG